MSNDFDVVSAAMAAVSGVCGAIVLDEDGGEIWSARADERFPTASVIKVPLVAAVYAEAAAGRLDPGERLRVSDRIGGSGVLHHLRDIDEMTLRDLATIAITVSDNTATNLLIERIGMDVVNTWLEAWGCADTRLERRMQDMDAVARGLDNRMSPRDAARLLSRLVAGECGGKTASDAVLAALERCQDGSLLGRFLPSHIKVAHKTGSLPRVRNDIGILMGTRRVIVATFVRDAVDVGRAADWIGLVGAVVARQSGQTVDLPTACRA